MVVDKVLTLNLQISSLDDYPSQAVFLRPVHNYHSSVIINERHVTRHADDWSSHISDWWDSALKTFVCFFIISITVSFEQ